jgi:hypothetical protein
LSPWWSRRQVPPKRRLLQEPHGVTIQKTPFFIVTAVKTSNLTKYIDFTLPHIARLLSLSSGSLVWRWEEIVSHCSQYMCNLMDPLLAPISLPPASKVIQMQTVSNDQYQVLYSIHLNQ